MSNYDEQMLNQQIIAVSIFSFLDDLLSHVRQAEPSSSTTPVESQPPTTSSISNNNTATTNNSTSLVDQKVLPGGYAEEIFLFLSETEKDDLSCRICFAMLKDAHQCKNSHLFCYGCIYSWCITNAGSAEFCPVCRCEGLYARNEKVNEKLFKKRCCCRDSGCNWRGSLKDYDQHTHRLYEPKEIDLNVALPQIKSIASKPVTSSTLAEKMTTQLLPSKPIPPDATVGATTTTTAAAAATVPGATPTQGTTPILNSSLRPTPPQNARRSSVTPRRVRPQRISTSTSGEMPSTSTSTSSSNDRPIPLLPNSGTEGNSEIVTSSTSLTPRPPSAQQNSNSTTIVGRTNRLASLTQTQSISDLSTTPLEESFSTRPSRSSTPIANVPLTSLEYKRLAPIQHRRAQMTTRLQEGREQLAMMLTLMTLELEDRRRSVERQVALNMQREQMRQRQLAEVEALHERLARVSSSSNTTTATATANSIANSSTRGGRILPGLLRIQRRPIFDESDDDDDDDSENSSSN